MRSRNEHPPAPDDAQLQVLVDGAQRENPIDHATTLFIEFAKAQPFEDGNKRTALFVANSVLIRQDPPRTMAVSVDERDPTVADAFSHRLARAYVFDEHEGVAEMLRDQGVAVLAAGGAAASPGARFGLDVLERVDQAVRSRPALSRRGAPGSDAPAQEPSPNHEQEPEL